MRERFLALPRKSDRILIISLLRHPDKVRVNVMSRRRKWCRRFLIIPLLNRPGQYIVFKRWTNWMKRITASCDFLCHSRCALRIVHISAFDETDGCRPAPFGSGCSAIVQILTWNSFLKSHPILGMFDPSAR